MKKLDTFEFFVVHALGNLSIVLRFENKLEIVNSNINFNSMQWRIQSFP